MRQLRRTARTAALAACCLLLGAAGTATAHVRYVTDEDGEPIPPLEFAWAVLTDPVNAALLVGGGLAAVVAVGGYLRYRPLRREVGTARGTLRQYTDLVPWLLRLSVGLPLVGAGFGGYLYSPAVPTGVRLFQIALGFLLLFGLASRIVAAVGLLVYVVGIPFDPDLLLASEFVGGFLGIVILGSGRPSADQVLEQLALLEESRFAGYGPVHRLLDRVDRAVDPYEDYAPTVVRASLGLNFVYLGLWEKIANPGRALLVVEKYDLTGVVPIDPGLWVVGVGLAEAVIGLALLAGVLTRGVAAVAFLLFTTTLFALPDDPVIAHISLFGLVSVLLVTGSGPLAIDNRFGREIPDLDPSISGA